MRWKKQSAVNRQVHKRGFKERVINFLADAWRDSGELDSKQCWDAGIKRLRTHSRPLLPLIGATHVCKERKGFKIRERDFCLMGISWICNVSKKRIQVSFFLSRKCLFWTTKVGHWLMRKMLRLQCNRLLEWAAAQLPDCLTSCLTLGTKWEHIEQTDMLAWQFV